MTEPSDRTFSSAQTDETSIARLLDLDDFRTLVKANLLRALDAWNDGDIERLESLIADDVVLQSPLLETADKTVKGKRAFISTLTKRQAESPHRQMVDVLIDGVEPTLLMRNEAGFTTWTFSINSEGLATKCVVTLPAADGQSSFDGDNDTLVAPWYVHSWDDQTRRLLRAGPFRSEAVAISVASAERKGSRPPILIEGPGGEKFIGAELRELCDKARHE